MLVKLHYLHWHLDFLRENLGAMSVEHGEWVHQEIHTMEK